MRKSFFVLAGALLFLVPSHAGKVEKPFQEPKWARRVAVQTAIFEKLLQRQMNENWQLWQGTHAVFSGINGRPRAFRAPKCFVLAPYNGKLSAISPIVFQRLRSRRVGKCLIVGQERWLKHIAVKDPDTTVTYRFAEIGNSPSGIAVEIRLLRFLSANEAQAITWISQAAEPGSEGEGSAEEFFMKLKRDRKGWRVTSMILTMAAG